MNVLVYLLPLALLLGLTGLFAFLWSLKSGQYDDLDGAAVRVLSDDDLPSSAQPPAGKSPGGKSAGGLSGRGAPKP
ncbi:cbb3-type cytochrome oxidase assembly protein CcoS [Xanthobacter oligotrophicus]|uniref:cbb3-type cytochrome oxidase assembly protein CcoS n=1 Tax=Xanthobacter oligotrophicus TaxID=2607286 RepID=UPI0011F35A50|nr:cbb3-type cytochrome oxidase assembly protein CcoS [Xanthobacter oligotrophicus]MCG5235581.1 cbb3-type cytochrome oxidase assembly protein CcoS [Xanthobacter oligotrophicus]